MEGGVGGGRGWWGRVRWEWQGWGVAGVVETVAWVRVEGGRILCARSRGKDVFYLPGGKVEPGESGMQALVREISEELTVTLLAGTVRPAGTYEALQSEVRTAPLVVRMTCYTGEYSGSLAPSSEIAELAWYSYADRDKVPAVDQLLFDDLKAAGELR